MSHELSKRLSIVLPHLYPNLVNDYVSGDYCLQNDSDGNGTYLVWKTDKVTKPTDTELANAKEAAVDADWWRVLRKIRNEKLVASDWSQGNDIPSDTKTKWATYRTKLRDLPTTVSKPAYSELIKLEVTTSGIDNLMPEEPS
tara:strand:- start:9 stop:434 length:426 start_codon:yes stop_codon:yes gene_type:complete